MTQNQEGKRILDLFAATELAMTKTFFRKRIGQLSMTT